MTRLVFRHVWDTYDICADTVMLKFADCNIANRMTTGLSTEEEFWFLLHDLVLELYQKWKCTSAANVTRNS